MDDLFEHQMQSERDKAINAFYTHFTTYLGVMALLAIVALVSGDTDWIPWVVLGWGAGIGLHAYEVLVRRPKREHEAREKRLLAEEEAAARAVSEEKTGTSA